MDNTQSAMDIARKIIELAKNSTEGLSDDELSRVINTTPEQKIEILNQLIEYGYIKAEVAKSGALVYLYQDPEVVKRFIGLEPEDKTVYQIVADSKNTGVVSNSIRGKTGLSPQIITKILKKLEKKGLIKSVKSINAKNRNIWILSELDPSEDITGGIWYRNNEFDKDLIDALYNKTYNYIASQEVVSKKEISVFLRSSGMMSSDIKDENIQSIVNIMIYDDKIEEILTVNKVNPSYKISDWQKCMKTPVITQTPCGTCPVFLECKDGGIISPQTCIYFNDW